MLRKERLQRILKEINVHNTVTSAELSEKLEVSEDTIRRDLQELAQKGAIVKVHGGAMSKTFQDPFDEKTKVYALAAKQKIADKTIKLFKNEMTILVEGGTTVMEIAKKIPPNLRATFFSLSPQTAIALSQHENLRVMCLGGMLPRNGNLFTGAAAVNELAGIEVDLCIIGVNGLTTDGLTDSDWEVAQIIKAMIRSAKKTAVVTIAEKLDTRKKIKICDLDFIHYLITELPPRDPALSAYKGKQLTRL
jgi:DeoR/GlpR family transcriptional regulator of sugar metabolism